MSKEPQILEAITAMARIATLAFHPEGSKIAFRKHNIVICPPSADTHYSILPTKLIQGIDRYWNCDSRNDLHILNHSIKNFIDYYVLPYKKKDKKTYNNLINLAKYSCVGLMKLQRAYMDPMCNACLVIQLYINILRDLIKDKHDPSSFYIFENIKDKKNELINDKVGDENLTMSTIFDIGKFKTFWSQKELDKLCEQFSGCFKHQGEIEEMIFLNHDDKTNNDAFDKILNDNIGIDDSKEVYKIEEDNFSLPEPNNKYQPIVKGYIVSIFEILDAMDQRFYAILTQSIQGF